MLARSESRTIAGRHPALPGERSEAARALLVMPRALAIGVGVAVSRLLRKPKRLATKPLMTLEDGHEPLTDVGAFIREFTAEFEPRKGYGLKDFELVYAPDLIPSALDVFPRLANRWFSCSPPFKRVVIESLDGTPISAEVAFHTDRPRPGLVVTHGIFGSSGQRIYASPAMTAFEKWGFNVAVIDLRGWGKSAFLSKAPMSGGWREGEDILGAARYLMENGATTTVGGIGFSLGGASMLNAASHDLAPRYLASGVLSESGFTDSIKVLQLIERNPGLLRREYLAYFLFTAGFAMKFRAQGLGKTSMLDYLENVAAPHYGVSPDELHGLSSVIGRVGDLRVPVLQLHAEDDWIVKVEHALELQRQAARLGNARVGVLIKERGSHCAFSRVAPAWREHLAREYFSRTSGVRLTSGNA